MATPTPSTRYQTGNEMWHSDSSFRLVPSFVSITHAYDVPGEGGGTHFASMRSAYERLPENMQETIDPLHVLHDYVFSRSQVAPVDPNHRRLPAARGAPPRAHQPWERPQGLLRRLARPFHRGMVGDREPAAHRRPARARHPAPRTSYTHQWQVGDTVIWDNRCLLHRGAGYDADRWRRRMRQTRVAGSGPTLDE